MARKRSKPTKEIEVITRNTSPSPNRLAIYSDDAQISRNFYGFTVKFNQIIEIDHEKKELYLEERAVVSMSPEHAAAIHKVLGQQLEDYVETYGELRPRPSLRKGAEAPKSGNQPPGSA